MSAAIWLIELRSRAGPTAAQGTDEPSEHQERNLRMHNPAITFSDLPGLDVVDLSAALGGEGWGQWIGKYTGAAVGGGLGALGGTAAGTAVGGPVGGVVGGGAGGGLGGALGYDYGGQFGNWLTGGR
jgi:hypothetical protein